MKWNTIEHNYYIDPVLYRRTQGRYGTLDSAGMWAEVIFNRARNITFEENEITSGSDIVSAYLYGQTNLTLRYNEYFTLHNDPCNAWFIRDTTGDGIPDVFYNTFHLYVKRTGWDVTSQLANVSYNSNGCGTSLLARQSTPATLINRVTAFPNPATDRLKITVQQAKAGTVNAQLWDLTGKLLLIQQKQLPAGISMMGWDDLRLPPGLYLLKVKQEIIKIVIR